MLALNTWSYCNNANHGSKQPRCPRTGLDINLFNFPVLNSIFVYVYIDDGYEYNYFIYSVLLRIFRHNVYIYKVFPILRLNIYKILLKFYLKFANAYLNIYMHIQYIFIPLDNEVIIPSFSNITIQWTFDGMFFLLVANSYMLTCCQTKYPYKGFIHPPPPTYLLV